MRSYIASGCKLQGNLGGLLVWCLRFANDRAWGRFARVLGCDKRHVDEQ